MIILRIPCIGPSLNKFYSGMHPGARKRLADKWHYDIGWLVKQQKIEPLPEEEYPATVQVYCYFGPGERRFDADNLAPTAKLSIDGLKEAGILKKDSAGGIRVVELIPFRTDEQSYTIVKIFYDEHFNENHRKDWSSGELKRFAEAIRGTLRG